MQENEFEDELGKNMEGFGIEPSANVWPEVERRIRQEKKRRFALWFWFLLLLIGGGITTAILFNPVHKKNNQIAETQTEKNINNPVLTPAKKDSMSIRGKTNDAEINRKENLIEKETIAENVNNAPAKTNRISTINSSLSKHKNNLYENSKPEKITLINKAESQSQNTEQTKNIKKNSKKQPEATATDSLIAEEKSIVKNIENVIDTTAEDKKNNLPNLETADSESNDLAITDRISNSPIKEKKNLKIKKWNYGLLFSAGKSGFSKSLFSLNNAMNADLSYSSPGSGSGTIGAPAPSAIKPSLALSGGIFMKKSISKRLDISIGINYNYLSTQRSIGSRVDSTREVNNNSINKAIVSKFYRPATIGNSNNYTNQFHFIGLQTDVAWEIITGKKFKIYWENGIAYNRMVSSSMLHFSTSLPGYYKDNSLLNKNQLSFSSGLLLPIGDKLMLKPFINYNLTKLFKNYATSNPHLSNLGLQVKYIFKNK